ncbi:MAG: SUMF1/EgtB/PvdO family nonheme iron enzyme [Verrucomicrobia bacterium]|nr:SUMF1/EgtB/PvdO family nonheme iron enzyme [Verrucomicrobiota bacterium]
MKPLPHLVVTLAVSVLFASGCRRVDSTSDKLRENPPASTTSISPVPSGFVIIPAGEFIMGDALDGDQAAAPHKVTASGFFMQQKEVTEAQWDEGRVEADRLGYYDLFGAVVWKAPQSPVQEVTWYAVVKWCNLVSEIDGLTPCYYTDAAHMIVYRNGDTDLDNTLVNWDANGYRLPTEAEWEKAARGGLSGKRFPWGDAISHREANFANDGVESYQTGTTGFHPTYQSGKSDFTSPVGSFAANGYGLYDMAGNALEWCWDRHGSYPAELQKDPRGTEVGSSRVLRGGAWRLPARACRVAARDGVEPGKTGDVIGFRIARAVVP